MRGGQVEPVLVGDEGKNFVGGRLSDRRDTLGLHTHQSVFLPQDEVPEGAAAQEIFEIDRLGLEGAEVVVAVLDGADADSGTSWECGYAAGRGMPVVAVRTDIRGSGDDEGWNAMLRRSAAVAIELPATDEDLEPLVDAIEKALSGL